VSAIVTKLEQIAPAARANHIRSGQGAESTNRLIDPHQNPIVRAALYSVIRMICPTCRSVAIKSGRFRARFLDVVDGKPKMRSLLRQRWLCRKCGTWTERPDMHPTRAISIRAAQWIREQSTTRANADIARECGVDEGTIRRLLAEPHGE